jgi:hypothetical protein
MNSPTEENLMRVEGFSYRNFTVPVIEAYRDPFAKVEKGDNYELSQNSGPLSWKFAFYTVGRDLKLCEESVAGIEGFNDVPQKVQSAVHRRLTGLDDAYDLPESVKEYGRIVYSTMKKENGITLHRGAVLIEPEVRSITGNKKPGDGYTAARFFPNGFVEVTPGKYELNEEGCEGRLWLPPSQGFIVPTIYGTYYPNGLPMATFDGRDDGAIKIWMEHGFTEERASEDLANFHIDKVSGPLLVTSGDIRPTVYLVGAQYWSEYSSIERFPARRIGLQEMDVPA